MKNSYISKAIKANRLRLALNQEELGRKCGFSKTTISHFEAGRRDPTIKSLVKLCLALGVTADSLLGI